MSRLLKKILGTLALAGGALSVSAFSLLGPFAQDYTGTIWQTLDTGYQLPGAIGGPMDLTEEYRWNIRTITYGFDKSFLDYFGVRGVQEVNKAFAILNALPAASKMSPTLAEFPLNTRRVNFQAANLGIIDLKSFVLGTLVEEMGLASPERYVWTLRGRVPLAFTTNYSVIMRNWDPVTMVPTPYVNGVLYTYRIFEFGPAPRYNDAVESVVDPLAIPFTSVASSIDGIIAINPLGGGLIGTSLSTGQFYTGLTRDDVGGLRYLFNKKNFNYENLLTNAVGTSGGSPWSNPGAGASSSNVVGAALRPGIEKAVFKQMRNDSFIGNFIPQTNRYTDTFLTNNGHTATQRYQRVLTTPDILFAAADLGIDLVDATPVWLRRSDTSGWANNGLLNSFQDPSGPGVITPTILISLSNTGPYIANQFPGFMDQANNSGIFGGWGSFDGTTNTPIVYPNSASIEQLENMILNAAR